MKIFFILIIFIIFLIFIIVRDYQIKKKKFKLNNALNSNFFIQTINNLIEENKNTSGILFFSRVKHGQLKIH